MNSEADFEQLLTERFRGEAPSLGDSSRVLAAAMDEIRNSPQNRTRSAWLRRWLDRTSMVSLASAAVVVVVAAGVGLAFANLRLSGGGDHQSGATLVPTGSTGSTAGPTASAAPAATSTAPSPPPSSSAVATTPTPTAQSPEGASLEVTAMSVAVRAEPSTVAPVIDSLLQGRGVYVLGPARQAEGLYWHRIEFEAHGLGGETIFGWVGSPPGPPQMTTGGLTACPTSEPDVTTLAGMLPAERYNCFENGTLILRGTLVSASPPPPLYVGSPEWLAQRSRFSIRLGVEPAADGGMIEVHLSPSIDGDAFVGQRVEVVGHFGDPNADSCERTPAREGLGPETESEQRLWCLQQFVVTEIKVDPSA